MNSLQVYVSRGNQYARIVESYRDPGRAISQVGKRPS